jgi:hypothetical protein
VLQFAAMVECDRCAAPSPVRCERNTIVRAILPLVERWKLSASRAVVKSFLALAKCGKAAETREAAVEVEAVLTEGGAR